MPLTWKGQVASLTTLPVTSGSLPTASGQRMIKNLEKEVALLKQELAIHDSLVRCPGQGRLDSMGPGSGCMMAQGQGR